MSWIVKQVRQHARYNIKNCDESLCYIVDREFQNQLRGYESLETDSAPWS
jgi:hypothetical protein